MYARSSGQFAVVTAGTVVATIFQLVAPTGETVSEYLYNPGPPESGSIELYRLDGIGQSGRLSWYLRGVAVSQLVTLTGHSRAGSPLVPRLRLGTVGATDQAELSAEKVRIASSGLTEISGATLSLDPRTNITDSSGNLKLVGIWAGTAAQRPTAPIDGDTYYETDTRDQLQYYSTSGTWRKQWSMPWGRVASVVRTADSAATGAAVIYPNSVTFNAVANRRYRVMANALVTSTAGNDSVSFGIADNAGTIINQHFVVVPTATYAVSVTVIAEITFLPTGSATFQTSLYRALGVGNVTNVAGATAFTTLLIEDIGPVSNVPA